MTRWPSALSLLKERGLSNVKIAGIDGIPEALKEVAKGGQYVATDTSFPPYPGGFCGRATVRLLTRL